VPIILIKYLLHDLLLLRRCIYKIRGM